jgi:hypothetical protein
MEGAMEAGMAVDIEARYTAQFSTIEIPCILNRASLGDANYVFAVITDVAEIKRKIAWVPREDITVVDQPLSGSELNAKLKVKIVSESSENIFVSLNNDGVEEILSISR